MLRGRRPVGEQTGLHTLRGWLEGDDQPALVLRPGHRTTADLLAPYAAHLHALAPMPASGRRLKVVVDAGNGTGGLTTPTVVASLDVDLVPLHFTPDGTFPHHDPNPMEPENLADLQNAVIQHGADLGIAFDGDADRVFFVNEKGQTVTPSATICLIAAQQLALHPGATVVHNTITSASVAETIREHGGTPVATRTGHEAIKALMDKHDAPFGAEHSGHYYFRDFWYADTGMLAALHLLTQLAATDNLLSHLVANYQRYAASGEINIPVTGDHQRTLALLEEQAAAGATIDHSDGLTARFDDGSWFNLRASNTEPLLRLNIEAPTEPHVTALRDQLLCTISAPSDASTARSPW